jgi:Fe-S cluster assembly iron-binding protein IscA
MLTITESAKNHLTQLLRNEDDVLRLAPTENGLRLIHDQSRPGDEVHEHDGSPLLVLEESVSSSLGPQTLDIAFERGKAMLLLR